MGRGRDTKKVPMAMAKIWGLVLYYYQGVIFHLKMSWLRGMFFYFFADCGSNLHEIYFFYFHITASQNKDNYLTIICIHRAQKPSAFFGNYFTFFVIEKNYKYLSMTYGDFLLMIIWRNQNPVALTSPNETERKLYSLPPSLGRLGIPIFSEQIAAYYTFSGRYRVCKFQSLDWKTSTKHLFARPVQQHWQGWDKENQKQNQGRQKESKSTTPRSR